MPQPREKILPEGYTIDLLATFEHPVDTRPQSFQKAIMLAITDLPPAGKSPIELDVDGLSEALRKADCMLRPPKNQPFTAPMALWSRARHWQATWEPETRHRGGHLHEAELIWTPGAREPDISGHLSPRTHDLAWAQAFLGAGGKQRPEDLP